MVNKTNYFEKIKQNISEYGFHITFVFDKNLPSFCYTTGVYESFGIPELFISSLLQNLSFQLASDYVKTFKNNTIPLHKKTTVLSDRFPVFFIDADLNRLNDYILSSKKIL